MQTLSWIGLALLALSPTLSAQELIPDIGPIAPVEQAHDELQFTEGPTWDGDRLYFTDIPANRIYKSNGKTLEVFAEPSGHCNGLMFAGGQLYACSMDGRLVLFDDHGNAKSLASEYDGKRFNAPNDLVIDGQGGIYFTDPRYRAPEPWPQGIEAVYYRDATGKVTRVIDSLNEKAPNGVILSPNEKTLYVVCSMQAEVMAYDVVKPGQLDNERVFVALQQPAGETSSGGDGLTIDTNGNLYVTSALGVQVISPEGQIFGVIELPEQPANVTFGGANRKTLIATARTSVYKLPMKSTGHVFPGPLKEAVE